MGQSDRAQSVKSSEPEANDTISDQLHLWQILNKNKPNSSIQDAGIAGMLVVCHTHDMTYFKSLLSFAICVSFCKINQL